MGRRLRLGSGQSSIGNVQLTLWIRSGTTGARRRRAPARLLSALLCCAPALLAAPKAVELVPGDLTNVSLEELSQIKVTSVAKKQQSLIRAAAAVYVITAEDIRRSGATRIPEALRMAPGLEVAQIDANQWAISARGFNGRFSNKLLVMIDGRTIYSPLFSGVYWDIQDIPIENIDRIEVVRGPGGTIWGANAVNGVINIITKAARETQGGSLQASYGTQSGPHSTVRYGGAAGGGHDRVYARYQARRASPDGPGMSSVMDPMDATRGGFRYDVALSSRDELRFDAELHRTEGRQGMILVSPRMPVQSFASTEMKTAAGHVLGRWKREVSDRSDITVQAYYDSMDRDETVLHRYSSKTIDLEFQHRYAHSKRAEVTWGLEYRDIHGELAPDRIVHASRDEDQLHFLSAFAQEEL
jgi:iron complex outermembrane receptor protein